MVKSGTVVKSMWCGSRLLERGMEIYKIRGESNYSMCEICGLGVYLTGMKFRGGGLGE